jgi:hypothetical protein
MKRCRHIINIYTHTIHRKEKSISVISWFLQVLFCSFIYIYLASIANNPHTIQKKYASATVSSGKLARSLYAFSWGFPLPIGKKSPRRQKMMSPSQRPKLIQNHHCNHHPETPFRCPIGTFLLAYDTSYIGCLLRLQYLISNTKLLQKIM